MSYLERKYISFLSSRLTKFKWKSPNLANCRCPLCGDSKTNPNKARFYLYAKNNDWYCSCHNCSYSAPFKKFLQRIDERLYSEYVIELMKDRQTSKPDDSRFIPEPKFDGNDAYSALMKLEKVSQLPPYHPAWKYVKARKIPNEFHAFFRWNPSFMKWTNDRIPGKFKKEALVHDEGRLLIPFFNKNNHFFAYTGRSLAANADVRYITIVLNANEPLLWGVNKINFDKMIKVTEGPIDATFLSNCISMAGGNFSSLTKIAERDRFIIILDNEPRSKEAKAKFARAIENGFKVVFWPHNIAEKDINAMVLAGYSPGHIEYIISSNTFEGLEAKMKLDQWSKV